MIYGYIGFFGSKISYLISKLALNGFLTKSVTFLSFNMYSLFHDSLLLSCTNCKYNSKKTTGNYETGCNIFSLIFVSSIHVVLKSSRKIKVKWGKKPLEKKEKNKIKLECNFHSKIKKNFLFVFSKNY